MSVCQNVSEASFQSTSNLSQKFINRMADVQEMPEKYAELAETSVMHLSLIKDRVLDSNLFSNHVRL